VTFEYVLIDGINDKPCDGRELIKILKNTDCKLNVIPYNEIDGRYRRPSEDKINNFLNSLKDATFPVTVRWSKGQDIEAGCGQLATNFNKK
jgi:23S rRNA (adenine2503-C2)-methyltransferase